MINKANIRNGISYCVKYLLNASNLAFKKNLKRIIEVVLIHLTQGYIIRISSYEISFIISIIFSKECYGKFMDDFFFLLRHIKTDVDE